MRTNVASTSIESYREEKQSGREVSQKERVLAFVRSAGVTTRREVAERLGLQLSAVCGRVNALIAAGLVKDVARVKCKRTGKSVHQIKAVPQSPGDKVVQKDLF